MALFTEVGEQVEALARQMETQAAALQALQARLAKTSENSSKPPSSDGYAKQKRTTSLRQRGQKPRGGQQGHRGDTWNGWRPRDHGGTTVVACAECGASLADVAVTTHDERQVFDIPGNNGIEVTAHRAEVKTCAGCGADNRGVFPVGVKASTIRSGREDVGDLFSDPAFCAGRAHGADHRGTGRSPGR